MGTCYFISLFINGELLRFLKLFIPIRYYQYIIFSHQYFKLLIKICLKKLHNNQHGLSFNHPFFYCLCRKPRLKKNKESKWGAKSIWKMLCCCLLFCFKVPVFLLWCNYLLFMYMSFEYCPMKMLLLNYLDAYCENKTYIVSSN